MRRQSVHCGVRPACRPILFLALASTLTVIPALALCGCLADDPKPPVIQVPAGNNPFAPVSLRVHPLTHVQLEGDAKPSIICHVEVRDAWGDSAKCLGTLSIRLFGPPAAAAAAGSAEGAATAGDREINRWDVNLNDLETNAAMFDPATRTYRIQLIGGPVWLAGFAPRPAEGTPAPKVSRAILQATLSWGPDQAMSDDLVLSR